MKFYCRACGCALLLAVAGMGGCRAPTSLASASKTPSPPSSSLRPEKSVQSADSNSSIRKVAYEPADQDEDATASPLQSLAATDVDDPFVGLSELPLEPLISAVHARNPSLQATIAAWAAAAERYPQAVALEDPLLQTMFAPASFAASSPVQSSFYVGVAQRIPWSGKRELRGQIAQWEANAASWTTQEMRIRLAMATRVAYFDYYLVRREVELNDRNREVVREFRATAKAKYEANQVSQQDLSLADLELAKVDEKRLELRQAERIAIARINTLLHRRPDHPLPDPISRLTVEAELPDSVTLREQALQNRPELAALAAKIQSERHAVLLACKEYYPDFEFMARYDAFWTDQVQRPQVGMNVNVPLNQGRRGAAVREAQFRVNKMSAEYAQQRDSVAEEVQIAIARVDASRNTARLYEDRILPAAQENLAAARAAYIAGTIDFLRVMEARKQFIEQQIGYQMKLTDYHRSHAELERAVGATLSAQLDH